MVLRWLDAALDDLRAIKVYIAEENPDAARRGGARTTQVAAPFLN